jgi:hypothetical protein
MSSCTRPLKAASAAPSEELELPATFDQSLVEGMMGSELVQINKETGGRGDAAATNLSSLLGPQGTVLFVVRRPG